MQRAWVGVAIIVAMVLIVWIGRGDIERPEAVNVTDPPPADKAAAPAVVAPTKLAAARGNTTTAPRDTSRRTPATATKAADPYRTHDSLVARAWSETASRREFDGDDPPPPKKKYPLTREGIQAAVADKKPELRECYEPWLKTQPGLGGKTVVSFDITRDDEAPDAARIEGVAVKTSELDHPFVEGCVQSVMQDLVFDPPADGKLSVNYPLIFSGDDEESANADP